LESIKTCRARRVEKEESVNHLRFQGGESERASQEIDEKKNKTRLKERKIMIGIGATDTEKP